MTPRWRVLLLLTALAAAGCGAPKPPAEEEPKSPVKWEPASRVVLEEWTELVGTTQPLPGAFARITAPIDGRIVSLLQKADGKPLHEGDEVAKGQEIARLDDRIPRLNLEKAQSAVKTAAEDRAQAQTALNLATDRLTGVQKLKAKDPNLDLSFDLKTAQGAEEDARSKLNTAEQHQEQAAKDVDVLNQQLQLYALTAPHKGRLGRVTAGLGQTLSLGAEVAQVVDLDDAIDVLCFVSQHDAARLRVGQTAGVGGLGDKPDEPGAADAAGQVVYIADQAEPETGCFAVKVRFPNKDLRWRGNVVRRVRILTKPGQDYLAIPESALTEDQEPPSVVIVEDVKTGKNADGKDEQTGTARRMQAVIGVRDRVLKQAAILGLKDQDGKNWQGDLEQVLFVTQKGQGLQTGDAVRLEEEEE
jgi:RND family efflux transporter MFP subunit